MELQMRLISMTKKSTIFVGIFCVFFFFLAGCSKPSVEQRLEKMVEETNKRTPIDYGEMLLDSMSLTDNSILHYYYTYKGSKEDLNQLFSYGNVQEKMIDEIVTNPEMKFMVMNKVTFFYIYFDKNGEKVNEIRITPEMYKQSFSRAGK